MLDRDAYNPSEIEPRWQRFWSENATFRSERHAGRPKWYVLDMFPYPSGTGLHVGHPLGYTATDISARAKRMQGFDVLHPMGWDAFGLPAEQHAILTGKHPAIGTANNVAAFKRQLISLGLSYDWSREVNTTDPAYVRWTQWIFLQLFKKGLAYQAEIPVNWCPALGTVLANEEIIDGKSERGGHPVQRVPLRQWMLRITAYADRLEEDLAPLDWPDTKGKQRHWIGRSEGARVTFRVEGRAGRIDVFTTRVDTLSGVTYIVIAPEHPLLDALTSDAQRSAVTEYVEVAKARSEMDRSDATKTKTGVALGTVAINPLTQKAIPIWVADYVLGGYGTGAVMAVPAHDARDHVFAKQYGLPIIQVIAPCSSEEVVDVQMSPFTEDGLLVNTGEHVVTSGTPSPEARRDISVWLKANNCGGPQVTYRIRDWVFSRQRYWGEPIPIIFPVQCVGDPRVPGATFTIDYATPIPLEESELPLPLPELDDFRPGDDPAGPLARNPNWRFFEKGGKWFARETNTMPQWAGSCWYYLRFLDPNNQDVIFDAKAYDEWMPVDLYVGGSEHAVLHLLYARFWHKVLFDLNLVKHKEPFLKLFHQGMILGENNEKMSKSRGNVINPDDVIASHGADSLRVYEMFMGPLDQVKPWQSKSIEGARRFLDRVWTICTERVSDSAGAPDDATLRLVHKTVEKVTRDIEAMRFNTAISAMMILSKHLLALPAVGRGIARTLVLLVSPFAPHLGEELWQRLGGGTTIAYEAWPTFDPELVKDDVVEIPIQINGKLKGVILLAADASEEQAREVASAHEAVQLVLRENRNIQKVIYVPRKIINYIVR